MATASVLPKVAVEQYLKTIGTRPVYEYLDGELLEKPMGEKGHSKLRPRLASLLLQVARSRRLEVYTGLDLKISASQFRIADVAIYENEPEGNVPERAPLAVVELVSPFEAGPDLTEKGADYAAWGVPHIFIVDPKAQEFYRAQGGVHSPIKELEIPGIEATITKAQLFGE